LRDFCAERGLEFHAISAASGEGIPQLVRAMADALDRLAPREALEEDGANEETHPAETGVPAPHVGPRPTETR
jgi:hypothetical protein